MKLFQGSEFAYFAKHMGFKHRKVIPLWPRANGECERFMRNHESYKELGRRTNHVKKEFVKFLNYRATPHSTMGKSPAFALFGCEMKIKFPFTLEERERIMT